MNPFSLRTRVGSVLAVAAAVCCGAVVAQEFPSRPIRMIVPYTAGSTTDIIARIAAQPLAERLRQPITVDNRTGGGGTVGVNSLKVAAPDGYTIGLIVSGNVIQPWMSKDMPFDVRSDFVPLSLLWAGPYILTVSPAFPARSVAEFIAYAKAQKKPLLYGSSGVGTTTHLAGELLKQMTGIDMTHVPYKGSPEVVAGMMGGDVQFYFDLYGTVRPLLEAGKVRPLGLSSLKPLSVMPDLPTIHQTLPGFEVLAWTGFAVPAGTPREVTERLGTAIREALNQPEVQNKIAALGVQPGGDTPAQFGKFVLDEYAKWGKIIQAAGLRNN